MSRFNVVRCDYYVTNKTTPGQGCQSRKRPPAAHWDKRDLFNVLYATPPMFMFDRAH